MVSTKKKLKQRGDSVILRTKKNEPNFIIDWLNKQSNISESLRHLIEKDVAENGVRDVKDEILNKQAYVPSNTVYTSYREIEQTQNVSETNQEPSVDSKATKKEHTFPESNHLSVEDLVQTTELTDKKEVKDEPIIVEQSNEDLREEKVQERVINKAENKPDAPEKMGRKVRERNINLNNW